jgi:DNA-binding Xre family transcriptional regulator
MDLKSLKKSIERELELRNWSRRELARKVNMTPQSLNIFLTNEDNDIRSSSLFTNYEGLKFGTDK